MHERFPRIDVSSVSSVKSAQITQRRSIKTHQMIAANAISCFIHVAEQNTPKTISVICSACTLFEVFALKLVLGKCVCVCKVLTECAKLR